MLISKKKTKINPLYLYIGFLFFVFFAGLYLGQNELVKVLDQDSLKNKLKIYLSQMFMDQDSMPKIIFDINFEEYAKLNAYEKIASEPLIRNEAKKFITATLSFNGKKIKTKLRLKGDKSDHFGEKDEKFSYRVKIVGNNAVFGMKEFSLQHPGTRSYIKEWVFHRFLKHVGLLSLRYYFVTVKMNGENLGIYALEEHFAKELLEFNKKREGPIIRIKENLLWENEKIGPVSYFKEIDIIYSSPIIGFNQKSSYRDKPKRKMLQNAITLFSDFLNEKRSIENVFDLEKIAKFYAALDVLGAHHAARWHNLRFYYNPLTGLLEPIGFDASIQINYGSIMRDFLSNNEISPEGIYFNKKFQNLLFNNKKFLNKYYEFILKYADFSFLSNFFKSNETEFIENLSQLLIEYEDEAKFNVTEIMTGVSKIKSSFMPKDPLTLFLENEKNGEIIVKAGNKQLQAIELLKVQYKGNDYFPNDKIIFNRKKYNEKVKFKRIRLVAKNFKKTNLLQSKLVIFFQIPYINKVLTAETSFWPEPLRQLKAISKNTSLGDLKKLNFLKIFKNKIIFKKGNWDISETLVFSEKYKVHINSGTTLNFKNKGSIISNGGIEFKGSPNDIIIIKSNVNSGGILVRGAKSESIIENVIFKNLSLPPVGLHGLSGSITFYESNVIIKNTLFSKNEKADDMLNIIRSSCGIENSKFEASFADAIDIDFSNCRLENLTIQNAGNDAIDFSGSNSKVKNVKMVNVGDKGLSIGESSKVSLENIRIENAKYGIVSKDNSLVNVEKVNLSKVDTGFAAYQKKGEFGPAKIFIDDFSYDSNQHLKIFAEVGPLSLIKSMNQNIYNDKKTVLRIKGKTSLNEK